MDLQQTDREKLEEMEKSVEKIEQNVLEIKNAFLGNPEWGTTGFKTDLEKAIRDIAETKESIRTLQNDKIENKVYKQIITWLICVIATGFVGGFISLVFSYFQK